MDTKSLRLAAAGALLMVAPAVAAAAQFTPGSAPASAVINVADHGGGGHGGGGGGHMGGGHMGGGHMGGGHMGGGHMGGGHMGGGHMSVGHMSHGYSGGHAMRSHSSGSQHHHVANTGTRRHVTHTQSSGRVDRGNRAGHGDHDRGYIRGHGHRYAWGSGIWFYDGYYYGDCAWLHARALDTGSDYWWYRYERCRAWS